MKRLLISLLFLFTLVGVKAENKPTLLLEVQYSDPLDVHKINVFTTDTNFCEKFDVCVKKSGDELTYTKIIHKESGLVLGEFYGTPTKEFIIYIYNNRLTPSYIGAVIPKMLTTSKKG